jgi:hypothetical protein
MIQISIHRESVNLQGVGLASATSFSGDVARLVPDELRDVEHVLADVPGDARRLDERSATSRQCIPEEESRVLRELHGNKRLRFSDDQPKSPIATPMPVSVKRSRRPPSGQQPHSSYLHQRSFLFVPI